MIHFIWRCLEKKSFFNPHYYQLISVLKHISIIQFSSEDASIPIHCCCYFFLCEGEVKRLRAFTYYQYSSQRDIDALHCAASKERAFADFKRSASFHIDFLLEFLYLFSLKRTFLNKVEYALV